MCVIYIKRFLPVIIGCPEQKIPVLKHTFLWVDKQQAYQHSHLAVAELTGFGSLREAGFRCGPEEYATPLPQDGRGGWERLSVDDILSISDWITELPSVDNYIRILQNCKEQRDLSHAKHVHSHVCNHGLESHHVVGNNIVRMFVECGSVLDARKVFDRLAFQSVHSWTSLIWGYIQSRQLQVALNLYQAMHEEAVAPSSYTLVALLKACTGLRDMENGQMIHGEIVQMGCDKDPFVGSMLVDMYAKFGSLPEALEIFGRLSVQDVVSWSALIAGYAEHGFIQEALNYYLQMQLEKVSPNAVTFLAILKACSSIEAIDKGREFHNEVLQRGFERDLSVGNTLVDMYAKCGSFSEAKLVFVMLPVQDSVAWSALIAGYAEDGLNRESLDCFEQMHEEGTFINAAAFVCTLKACGSIEAINKGQQIHTQITQKGFEDQIYVGNALVDMYAKCGLLSEAWEVFDKLSGRDVVSWNALMTGHAEHGPFQEALKCFEKMKVENVYQDAVTFVCALKACGNMGSLDKGQEMHMEVMHKAFEGALLVGGTLVDMYAKCGALAEAQKVFDCLSTRNIVLWNALIAGYAEHGHGYEALKCFEQLQVQGVFPNDFTYVCVFKACNNIGAIDQVRALHMKIEQMGLERDFLLGSGLVDIYAKSGLLAEAHKVFNKLRARNVMSWNVLIAGYAEHGPSQAALDCLNCMLLEGVSPDTVTLSCIVKACGDIGSIDVGRELHTQITCKGFEIDHFIGSTLVDMYAKCGFLAEAQEVFQKLPVQSIVLWNTAITGHTEHGSGDEVLQYFKQMQVVGISGDTASYVGILKACIGVAAINKGREMHREIVLKGLERDVFVGSTLVAMYAKCGSLSEARDVFDKLQARNVVVWNAMIKGYGMNHEGDVAIKLFEYMQEENVEPDAVTFTCLLTACSRASLVDKGQELFKLMRGRYGIVPTIDHFSCMVDLLGRSGHLYEADKLLETMPCSSARDARRALLTACKTFEEAELGLRCFQQLVH